jgi:hypothetical protein
MVGSLAVFGLVVSSLVTTLGVAAVGVNVQLALAGQIDGTQTAALALGDRVDHPMMVPASTSEEARHMPRPDIGSSTVGMMGSSTLGMMGSTTRMFCPKIMRTIGRGNTEATTTGDVGQLQQFIANHFGLKSDDVVSGYFGSTTAAYLMKFQQEQGIAPAPTVGPLTRAAIAKVCGGDRGDKKGEDKGDGRMGSSTQMMGDKKDGDMRHGSTTIMGSTTMPVRPHDDMMLPVGVQATGSMPHIEHRKLPTTPTSVTNMPQSMVDGSSSNAAAAIEAVAEIGDGFSKLTQAYLSVFGL